MSNRFSPSRGVAAILLVTLLAATGVLGRPKAVEAQSSTALARPGAVVVLLCNFPNAAGTALPLPRDGSTTIRKAQIESYIDGHLNRYLRQVSYDQFYFNKISAVDWVTLPKQQSAYGAAGSGETLEPLANDCIRAGRAANTALPFSSAVGTLLIFNGATGNWGWTPGTKTFGGVTQNWRLAWIQLPAWPLDLGGIAHEVLHWGYGRHSANPRTPTAQSNPWDILGQSAAVCGFSGWGCEPSHPIAMVKDFVGWLPANRVYTHAGGTKTITLERLALPPSTTSYLLAKVPIGDDNRVFYSVEMRATTGYDRSLLCPQAGRQHCNSSDTPATDAGIIVHRVDLRDDGYPAKILSTSTTDFLRPALLKSGVEFRLPDAGGRLKVESGNSTSFRITITTPEVIRMGLYSVAYVADRGWLNWVSDGQTAGTTGESRRAEGFQFQLKDKPSSSVGLRCRAHVSLFGWRETVNEKQTCGWPGIYQQVEAIEISLVNAPAGVSIEYRCHLAGTGWSAWVRNGATCGTTGLGRRMEALQARIAYAGVTRGGDAEEFDPQDAESPVTEAENISPEDSTVSLDEEAVEQEPVDPSRLGDEPPALPPPPSDDLSPDQPLDAAGG